MNPNNPKLAFLVHSDSEIQLNRLRSLILERDGHEFLTGETCWSLETYHVLKQLGLNVELSNHYVPDAINFAHPTLISILTAQPGIFIVSLQADYPECGLAQRHIVQNKTQIIPSKSEWLPHWSMPGLIPRNPHRNLVQNVGFTGIDLHLVNGEKRWHREMESLGLRFIRPPKNTCHDLSNIDILVGIRNFDQRTWDNRPAWKMTNAWAAGIPFIAGVDSAYSQVGQPGTDHLVARSWEETRQLLLKLRDDSDLYRRLVLAGREHYAQYNHSAVAAAWRSHIEKWLIPAYHHWQKNDKGRLTETVRVHYWNWSQSVRRQARKLLKRINRRYRS